eukprot:Gb_27559 [translate_table: standard]
MPQVHPHLNLPSSSRNQCASATPTALTVWKKSLVFNGDGFTVFDSTGNLVFRVDNYASKPSHQVLLMDRAGNVEMAMRRKRLCIYDRWEAFRGDMFDPREMLFSVKKSSLISVKMRSAKVWLNSNEQTTQWDYKIEGSLCRPSRTIYSASGSIVAELKQKQTTSQVPIGDELYHVVVQPGMDQMLFMGFIVVFNYMRRI